MSGSRVEIIKKYNWYCSLLHTWGSEWTVSLNQRCSTLSDSTTCWSDLNVNAGWSALQILLTLQNVSISGHLFMLEFCSEKYLTVRWNHFAFYNTSQVVDRILAINSCSWHLPYSVLHLDIMTCSLQTQYRWGKKGKKLNFLTLNYKLLHIHNWPKEKLKETSGNAVPTS